MFYSLSWLKVRSAASVLNPIRPILDTLLAVFCRYRVWWTWPELVRPKFKYSHHLKFRKVGAKIIVNPNQTRHVNLRKAHSHFAYKYFSHLATCLHFTLKQHLLCTYKPKRNTLNHLPQINFICLKKNMSTHFGHWAVYFWWLRLQENPVVERTVFQTRFGYIDPNPRVYKLSEQI